MSFHHAIKIFHLISQCKTLACCQSFWNMIFWHHIISLRFLDRHHTGKLYKKGSYYIFIFPPDFTFKHRQFVYVSVIPTINFSRRNGGDQQMELVALRRPRPRCGYLVRHRWRSRGKFARRDARSQKVAAWNSDHLGGREGNICTFLNFPVFSS